MAPPIVSPLFPSNPKDALPSTSDKKCSPKFVRIDNNFLSSAFPRRKQEGMKGYSQVMELYHQQVLRKFGEIRKKDLVELRRAANDLESKVTAASVPFKATRVIPFVQFQRILIASSPSLHPVFPLKFVKELIKITNFNATINIHLILAVLNVIVRAEETYCALLPYAENSRTITEANLQTFVIENYLNRMKETVESMNYYAAYIVGIIFFVLGSRRKEVVQLQDLLSSALLWHVERCTVNFDKDEEFEVDVFTSNAFSESLKEFRALDTNRDGVLSEEEIIDNFRDGEYSERFLRRVFEISSLYDGCMDFKGYIDLFCALRFRHTTASAKYHFEAFDVKNDGVLDDEEIEYLIDRLIAARNPDKNPEVACALLHEVKDQLQMRGNTMTLAEYTSRKEQVEFAYIITSYVGYEKYESRDS